ncbi:hypothetical protein L484_003174 [Morus notabilis]|uniref:B-like cyclin n=1 Tax=Morus notabilis TaxID=981085 RepID=W9SRJ7_9ROSA|nr:hypothetical protein L484_003174 [Morus notabilis]
MRPGIAASGGDGLHMPRIGGLIEEGLPAAERDLPCSPWFLLSFEFQREKPWMAHLAFVACLSLSAKVEETQVPLLLDFQVEENKFVFEAKTIKRMELLVLSTLEWKMNPVTPISFLDYIIRRLGLKDHLYWKFLKRCENIVLSLISDVNVIFAYIRKDDGISSNLLALAEKKARRAAEAGVKCK